MQATSELPSLDLLPRRPKEACYLELISRVLTKVTIMLSLTPDANVSARPRLIHDVYTMERLRDSQKRRK